MVAVGTGPLYRPKVPMGNREGPMFAGLPPVATSSEDPPVRDEHRDGEQDELHGLARQLQADRDQARVRHEERDGPGAER